MKKFRPIFASAALIALLAVEPASAKEGWLTDYKQALEAAKTNKRLVLLDFTGSDWCGWCIRLDREIFSQPAFKDYASKNLVLLEIDFPRGRELTTAQREQNQHLAIEHQVQGFPTMVVLDSEGHKVAEFGYTPGGPAALIAELDRLRKG